MGGFLDSIVYIFHNYGSEVRYLRRSKETDRHMTEVSILFSGSRGRSDQTAGSRRSRESTKHVWRICIDEGSYSEENKSDCKNFF